MRLIATTSERQAALIKDWVTIRYFVQCATTGIAGTQ